MRELLAAKYTKGTSPLGGLAACPSCGIAGDEIALLGFALRLFETLRGRRRFRFTEFAVRRLCD